MGSKSDLPVVKKAIAKLQDFGVGYEAHVMSAHRTPDQAAEFSKNARENGFGLIIGIPIKSSTLDGLDALLATVQMPSGVPVATVAIDGAENAALLAVQMLALSDESLAQKLDDMKTNMRAGVADADAQLQQELQAL